MIARVTARRATRSALPWAIVFALYLAASAVGYATTYKTAADRATLVATFGDNAGVNALIGPAHRIDTVAGFTAWRSLGVLGVVGAVWALLLSTRLLRGEEEAGRWELLLAGGTTRRRAAADAVAGMCVGLVVLFVVPALTLVAVGQSNDVRFAVGASLFDVLAVSAPAVVLVAVGSLCSQLAPTRRRAAGYAAAVLGVAYATRMVADSGSGLAWLRWATPLGWSEEARPLTGSHPLALLPSLAAFVLATAATVVAAGRRDLGTSVIADRESSRAHTRLLGGVGPLSLRLLRPPMLGWAAGIAAAGLVSGLVSKSAGDALASASGFQAALVRLGARGVGARAYLGVVFLILALLVSLVAAGQAMAAREEESSGRLDHLLVRPVTRRGWLGARLLLATFAVMAAGVLAAVAAWVGAASQDSGVGLSALLDAGLNVTAPAAVVLGAGVLALGVRPRSVAVVVYGLIAWAFLVQLIGSVVKAGRWLLDTSVFHHLAPAPATNPRWSVDLVMLLLGAAMAVVGVVAMSRRDLAGE